MSQRWSAPASPPQPRRDDCLLLLGLLPQPLCREGERPRKPRPPWNAEKSGLARTLALPAPALPGNCTVGTPSAHCCLAVVPPYCQRRYYGEAPMRLRWGDGPVSGKPPQIRIPRRQEAFLRDAGAFTAEAGFSRLQMPLRDRKTVGVGTQVVFSAHSRPSTRRRMSMSSAS